MKRILNRGAVASLILSRTVYAINWYNVAALFAFIAIDFRQNISGLGILTASFYIGLGVFQIPGGIFAAKLGPRRTAVYGMLLSSVAVFLTAFTSSFYQFVLLRFFVGVGMALFFGPGVTLIAKAFRNESQGLGVGVFNGAFYVGAALGLFAWSILAEAAGWRVGIAIGGAFGILGGVLLLVYLPKDELRDGFVVKIADLRRILSNRWLMLLSLELFGFGSGTILVNTFMVYYLEQSLKAGPMVAGIVGSLSPLCAVLASPLFGVAYDRIRKAKPLLFILGCMLAVAVAIASMGSLLASVAATLIAGASGGAFTISYLSARKATAGSGEYESLAVSWVNCIQMFAGFWSPVAFSMIVLSFGYATSWLVAAAYTFLLISIILVGKESQRPS